VTAVKICAVSREQKAILREYGLEPARLRGVAACSYARGEYICLAGFPLRALFIVVSGRAKVSFSAENGRSLLLGFYQDGGLIGDLEFMTGSDTAHMGVQAVTPATCLSVPIAENDAELRENTAFLLCAGNGLAKKLGSSNESCAQIILYPLETRLCSYIAATAEDGCFREKLTETAELLGASYRHLMRALAGLCDRQLLEKRGGAYYIRDRDALIAAGMGLYMTGNIPC
jgi:CRP-like cAMP-binding protein